MAAQMDRQVVPVASHACSTTILQRLKEDANKLNNQIANLNKKSQEIEIWKIALVGDDQAGNVPDKHSVELVKNYVKQKYQPQ